MKKIKGLFYSIILLSILSSCTSAKLIKNWESDQFSETKKEKILVVARATDMNVRKAYEQEIVSKLKSNNINAVAAYEIFPDLKEKKNRSEEEINEIVAMFKNKKINAILLTALKNTKVEKSTLGNKDDDTYIPTNEVGKYGVSFTNYYNVNSVEYLSKNLKPLDDNYEYNDSGLEYELSSTTYTLETVIYNLSLEKEKQLIAIYQIKITDPNSAEQVLKGFSKLISKQFKK